MANHIFKFSDYLEPEEVRSIIDAIPDVSLHSERDTLLVEVLWQSGTRVTEALTLRPELIGLTSIRPRNLKQTTKLMGPDGKLVRDKNGKTIRISDTKASKEVEVSRELCQQLKDFCNKHKIKTGEYIFKPNVKRTGHLSRIYVWRLLGRAAEEARVYRFGKKNPKTGGRFKGAYPHLLRHSNAMKLLEETRDITIVKEQLGHSNISTTQGYAYAKRPAIRKKVREIKW